MNILYKSFKFIYGFFLFLLFSRKLNLKEILKDKRVAVVGAADSAYNTGLGSYLDEFDLIIRMNKAPITIKDGEFKKDIGSKTDILFHNFFENDTFGGGVLNFNLYEQLGIRYVINPIPTFFGYRNTFNFYKKYLTSKTIYSLSSRDYNKLKQEISPFRPTVGLCVLSAIINSHFSELYITGFTFFKTNYGNGYRKSFTDVNDLRDTMDKMKIHNPDLEFRIFLKLLLNNSNKIIMMDKVLNSIVHRENEEKFHANHE